MKRDEYLAMMTRLYGEMGRDNGYVPGWTTFTEVLLYQETGDPRYVDLLAQDMRSQLKRYEDVGILEEGLKRTGFKIPHRVAASAGVLLHHESFPEEEKATLRRFIGDLLSEAEYERGAMNRAFGFMAAINPLRRLYGPHPEDEDLDAVERVIGNDWTRFCEPVERAYGYEALTYLFLIDWIETGGHQEWYELPEMKRGLENLLYSRAGNGRCAVFGDWRPWEPCWGLYAAVLEKAAAVYQDGRFKFMAQQLIQGWEDELAKDVHQHPHDLMGLSYAIQWCDDTVPAEVPSDSPALITRNSGAAERLVLRRGWERDDLFATISLSDRDDHGHTDPLAINGLQAGGVLLEDNGRETRDNYHHNLLFDCDDPGDFPVPRYSEKPGVWQTIRLDFRSARHFGFFNDDPSIPMSAKHTAGKHLPSDFDYDPGSEWVFLIRWLGIGLYTFRLKEARLVSGDRSEVITSFPADRDAWLGLSSVERSVARFDFDFASIVDEVPEDLGKLPPIFIGRRFPYPLGLEESGYDSIEIDYRIDGNLPEEDFHMICIGGTGGRPTQWYSFSLPQHGAEVAHYCETDQYVHAVCRSGGTSRTRRAVERRREVLFLKNRYVWVKDSIHYPDGEPFTAGPLWQIRRIVSRGTNWLVAEAERRLLIYFIQQPGVEAAAQEWEGAEQETSGSRHNRYTWYQRMTAASSDPVYFDTLLIPLEEDDDPERIVSSISVVHSGADGSTTLEIGRDRLAMTPAADPADGVQVARVER